MSLSIKELLAKVNDLTNEFTTYLEENGLSETTFNADSPVDYEIADPTVYVKKQVLTDLLQDLIWQIQGPTEAINNLAHTSFTDGATLDVVNYFEIPAAVPLDGDASYEEIAKKVRLPEEVIRRVLENAITLRIFAKVDPASMQSRIKHSSKSAALAKSRGLRAVVNTNLGNAGAATTTLTRALEKYSRGQEKFDKDLNKTAFSLVYSGGKLGTYNDMWDFIEKDGEGETKGVGWRQKEMVESMRSIKDSLNLDELTQQLTDWKALGKAKVVDVGGSAGFDDVFLVKNYPDLTIEVQDLPQCEPDFNTTVPDELKGQITFRAHSFFDPQPTPADIYLFKFIFYDWPQEKAIEIMRQLRPHLKKGTKIVMMEFIGNPPPEGVILPRSLRKATTATDVRMMSLFGHSERTAQDVQDVFSSADERYVLKKIDTETRPPVLLLEYEWSG